MHLNNEILIPTHNCLILGKPSIQKYNKLIIPYILKIMDSEESFLAIDTDGIMLNRLGQKLSKEGYSIVSINLRNIEKSIAWNPLALPLKSYQSGNYELCVNQLMDIALFIMAGTSGKKSEDPFWELSAADLFVGLSLILFKEAKEECEINIKSIYQMAQTGFSRFATSTIINQYLTDSTPELEKIKNTMSTVLAAPSDTRQSILSVFFQQLRALTNKDAFLNIMCSSNFEIGQICQKKIAVFLCYEDENTINLPIIKIFIKQAFGELVKQRCAFCESQLRFHFIFNDFLLLGSVPDIERVIVSGNKHGINFLIDANSMVLFKKIYGEETTEFIIAYCQEWIVMASKEIELLKKIKQFMEHIENFSDSLKLPYYLAEDEILAIKDSEYAKVLSIEDINYLEEKFDYLPPSATEKIAKVFDIKSLVESRKRDEIMEKLGNANDFAFNPGINAPKNLDVDELVARIDKKIAELELQEQLEKARGL